MTQLILATRQYTARIDRVWVFLGVAFLALALVDMTQALESLRFTGDALVGVSLFLALYRPALCTWSYPGLSSAFRFPFSVIPRRVRNGTGNAG